MVSLWPSFGRAGQDTGMGLEAMSSAHAGRLRVPGRTSTDSNGRSRIQHMGSLDFSKSSANDPQDFFRAVGPQTHRLPHRVMWSITLLTASCMAIINFCTIWTISFVVEWKFNTMQTIIDAHSVALGIATFVAICVGLATACMAVIFLVAPSAGSSGAPENKGWLNGNNLPGFFTLRNLIVRQTASMLANMSGYPVGREGPTVTMGSNLAFLITTPMARPYVRQYVDVQPLSPNVSAHHLGALQLFDEQHWEFVKRISCTVGGACGMAMLFDSPIGGIVYMFEEISSSAWPMEVTMRAFVGTTISAVLSRLLLNLCGTSTKAFVVYEFNKQADEWTWLDMPFFIILAAVMGPVSAYHTRCCLWVGDTRQKYIASYTRHQNWVKVLDAVLYITLVAVVYTHIALLGRCFELPQETQNAYVRYNCPQGYYNPIASLLLTTSEGAVKRLFSRKNANELHLGNELLAFLAYSVLNIGLTGVPVPSGNFTGSMLIGGLAGRIMGATLRHFQMPGIAASGVYAMIGSAAMLCGFKQMCVAVVVFISGCANDLNLVPPLMVSITVALLLNRWINERGFDEEQILRKGIPFLPAEPPRALDKVEAQELQDDVPDVAVLQEEAELWQVEAALNVQPKVEVFPVVKDEREADGHVRRYCVGFTTRFRLEEALRATQGPPAHGEEGREEEMGKLIARCMVRRSGSVTVESTTLPLARLADRSPYTLLEGMPATHAYALFAKAGVLTACIISEKGEYRGMISKPCLINKTRIIEAEARRLKSLGRDAVPDWSSSDTSPEPRPSAWGAGAGMQIAEPL